MHLKAIQIKESLLGLEDYEVNKSLGIFVAYVVKYCLFVEVALSVGHLASLYNYDMEEYHKVKSDTS